MTRRVEPVYIPAGARTLRLVVNSGSPETTGFYAIDYFAMQPAGDSGGSVLENGVFTYNARTTSPAGSPAGWRRGGWDPSIARMILRSDHPGIGLVDADQTKFGEWSMEQVLKPSAWRGGTYSLSWFEAYNVIGGSTHRATYVNVPPGERVQIQVMTFARAHVLQQQLARPGQP